MTFGKRQLLIGALVVALGAAVYLNWQFSGVQPVSTSAAEEASQTKQLGQTVYVNTELSNESAEVSQETKEASKESSDKSSKKSESTESEPSVIETAAELDSGLTEEQYTFFQNAKQRRAEAHNTAVEALTEVIEAADSTDTDVKDAAAAAADLASTIKSEADAETEIKTKGFKECIVTINNGSCTVIVTEKELNDATAVTIKDIINRQTGIDFDKITITGGG